MMGPAVSVRPRRYEPLACGLDKIEVGEQTDAGSDLYRCRGNGEPEAHTRSGVRQRVGSFERPGLMWLIIWVEDDMALLPVEDAPLRERDILRYLGSGPLSI